MYVCICQAVTDRDIRRAAAQGADSLDDLRDGLGVSAFCGSCAPVAQSVLDACTEEAGRGDADGRAAPERGARRGEPVVVDAGWFSRPAPSTA